MILEGDPVVRPDRFGRSLQAAAQKRFGERAGVLFLEPGPAPRKSTPATVVCEAELAEQIEDSMRTALSLCVEPKVYRDYDSLANDYTQSTRLLREAASDMRTLVQSVWQVNTDYETSDTENAQLREAFLEDYFGDMAKESTTDLTVPLEILTAEMEARPLESAEIELRDRVDRLVGSFAKDAAEVFARMQALELAGRIEWLTPKACDAFYYEDTVIHTHLSEVVIDGPAEDVEFDYERLVKRVRREVTTVSKDSHTVRHGLHLKVLGKALKSPIDRFTRVIPVDIRQFLKAVPPWLRPVVRIVEGTARFDGVIGRDIYEETRKVSRTEDDEWFKPCFCPLVTVGDYVLTGWGVREANIEKARGNYVLLYVLAVASLLLAGISMGLGQLMSPAWSYPASIAASLSLAAFVEARREGAIARQSHVSLWELTLVGLAWFTLSLGVLALAVGLAAPSWLLGAAGALVTVTGGAFLRRVIAPLPHAKQ